MYRRRRKINCRKGTEAYFILATALYKRAEVIFEHYRVLMNSKVSKKFSIRDTITKWGSLKHNKKEDTFTMCLSLRLIEQDNDFLEAVIVHELCHTFYFNHGKDFYALLLKYIPKYKEIKKAKRDYFRGNYESLEREELEKIAAKYDVKKY